MVTLVTGQMPAGSQLHCSKSYLLSNLIKLFLSIALNNNQIKKPISIQHVGNLQNLGCSRLNLFGKQFGGALSVFMVTLVPQGL